MPRCEVKLRLVESAIAILLLGCRAAPPSVAQPQPPLPEPDGGRVAQGPVAVWTVERAADPELVHLHIQAGGAVGALLVPWVEGVTLKPCRVQVHAGDERVQDLRLRYEPGGRLIAHVTGEGEQTLQRDARGRLSAGRGLRYRYEGGRPVELVDDGGRQHALRYEGPRLVEIVTTSDEQTVRQTRLTYEGTRLATREFRYADGAHAETWFIHDEAGRLVRVDIEQTDAEGRRRRLPSLVLDYEGDRLVRFGPAAIGYDEQGRVATLTADGTTTAYSYACPQ